MTSELGRNPSEEAEMAVALSPPCTHPLHPGKAFLLRPASRYSLWILEGERLSTVKQAVVGLVEI